MSKSQDKKGDIPAYPVSFIQTGVTLRQYYSGQALLGLLSAEAHPSSIGCWDSHKERAKQAVLAADALIKEVC